MLKYIQSVLGVGRINEYPSINTVKYIISRTDLQEIIFPLLIKHNLLFLTETRRNQFDLAFLILNNNILYFSNIPAIIQKLSNLPLTANDYVLLPFFLN
jgi:hypothetical protein